MNHIDNEINFPQKPSLIKKNDPVSKSITNVLLFLLISYFYFDKNIYVVVIVFIILIIHELGHLFAMRFFNYTDLKIFFIPLLGAYTSGNKKEISQKQSIVIYLCGPLPGILLGVGLYYYSLNIQSDLLYKTSFLFLIINLLNLLPIKPLDGGNLISALLLDKNNNLQKTFNWISIMAMVGVSIYLKAYILLILPFFMIINQLKLSKIDKIKDDLIKQKFDLSLSFDDLSDKYYWKVRTEIVKSFKIFQKINPDLLQRSEQENKIAEYVKLITRETIILKDVSSCFRGIILLIFILSIAVSFYYVRVMKGNDNPSNNKKLYEQLSNNEIEMMKKQCFDRFSTNKTIKNYEAFCDCYIDKIIQKYTMADFDRISKMDNQIIQSDEFRQMTLECAKISNDTIYRNFFLND